MRAKSPNPEIILRKGKPVAVIETSRPSCPRGPVSNAESAGKNDEEHDTMDGKK